MKWKKESELVNRSYAGIKSRNHLVTFFLHVPEIGVNLQREQRKKKRLRAVIREDREEGITA